MSDLGTNPFEITNSVPKNPTGALVHILTRVLTTKEFSEMVELESLEINLDDLAEEFIKTHQDKIIVNKKTAESFLRNRLTDLKAKSLNSLDCPIQKGPQIQQINKKNMFQTIGSEIATNYPNYREMLETVTKIHSKAEIKISPTQLFYILFADPKSKAETLLDNFTQEQLKFIKIFLNFVKTGEEANCMDWYNRFVIGLTLFKLGNQEIKDFGKDLPDGVNFLNNLPKPNTNAIIANLQKLQNEYQAKLELQTVSTSAENL